MKLYLHEECAVRKEDIVGIFDMDSATVSPESRRFLSEKEKEGGITLATEDIPVSFVVTKEKENLRVYLTRNAPRALCRRAERFGL